MDEFNQLMPQLPVDIRHPAEHDPLFQFHAGEGDVQVQAAALQRITDVPRIVAGEKNHGSDARLHRTDFGNRYLIVRQNFQQQRFEFVVGFVDFIDQQYRAALLLHGLEQGSGFEKLLRIEGVAELVQALHGLRKALRSLQQIPEFFLEHLRVQQLLAVFPFIKCLGFVQALVALQPNQGHIKQHGRGFRQLCFTHARGAFDQNRLAQLEGQKDGSGNLRAADVAKRFKTLLNGLNGGQLRKILGMHGVSS